jgi:GrpB-like predicted nucleotidyltransferase (UPF0157 family)
MHSDNLHTLTTQKLGQLFPIEIVEYDPAWILLFIQEKHFLSHLLGPSRALRIEHFGSTSIPGCPSKPVVDILVEIPAGESIAGELVSIMTRSNYHHMSNLDDHLMFVKGYTEKGIEGQAFHIHMGPAHHHGLWDRILFRDYCIRHPETMSEYVMLKRKLARQFHYDREAYTNGKSEFVKNVTELAKGEAR